MPQLHALIRRPGFVLSETEGCGMDGAVDKTFSQHRLASAADLYVC